MTLLFFNVERVEADWKFRNPVRREMTSDEVDVLAQDFGDIDRRARKIAKEALGVSGYKYLLHTLVTPTLIGACVAAILYVGSVWLFFNTKVESITNDVNRLQTREQIVNSQFEQVDKRSLLSDDVTRRERELLIDRIARLNDKIGELESKLDSAIPKGMR